MELYKPMPTNGVLTNKVTVADVLDKGKGAVILFDGEPTIYVCDTESSLETMVPLFDQ